MTNARSTTLSPLPSSPIKCDKFKLIARIKQLSPFINSKQKLLCKRLFKYLAEKKSSNIKIVNFAEKLHRLNLASFKAEVSFYFDLVGSISNDKMMIKVMKKHFRSLANKQIIEKKEKNLPSPATVASAIRRLYANNKKSHAILLVVMFLTGRRSIDLSRLKSKNVKKLSSTKFSAFVEKDKKHNFRRNFVIDLKLFDEQWCGISLNDFKKSWHDLLKFKLVFKKVVLASLARETATFQPHILRSIRAILLVREGNSVEQILQYIGWDDQRSLHRYIRLDMNVVRSLEWSEVMRIFNSQF